VLRLSRHSVLGDRPSQLKFRKGCSNCQLQIIVKSLYQHGFSLKENCVWQSWVMRLPSGNYQKYIHLHWWHLALWLFSSCEEERDQILFLLPDQWRICDNCRSRTNGLYVCDLWMWFDMIKCIQAFQHTNVSKAFAPFTQFSSKLSSGNAALIACR
jgi:hypothetical protein